MTSEDIVIILGLIAFIILAFFSFKMGYEGLFKNYRKEIKEYFDQQRLSVLIIRKPSKQERKNSFFKDEGLRFTFYHVGGSRTMYKKRVVETKDRNGKKEKHLLQITIRYFRKPKLEFNK